MINAETSKHECIGFKFPGGKVHINITRSLFDRNMAGIKVCRRSQCHLCTATNEQIKDLTMVRSGFSINRFIDNAKHPS